MDWRSSWKSNRITLFFMLVIFVIIGVDRIATQANQPSFLQPLTITLYEWTILLSAFGLLAGALNVVLVHLQRIQEGRADWLLSLVLLVVLTMVFTAGLLDKEGTASPLLEWVYEHLIYPVQSTLFALLAFFLAAAAYRYLRIGRVGGGWMLAGALSMFLIQMPLSQSVLSVPVRNLLTWLLEWPVMAAMRGVLLGAALSLMIVTIRFFATKSTS